MVDVISNHFKQCGHTSYCCHVKWSIPDSQKVSIVIIRFESIDSHHFYYVFIWLILGDTEHHLRDLPYIHIHSNAAILT
jgi:hypothetical protein